MESYYQRNKDRMKLNSQIYKLMNIDKVIRQNALYKNENYEKLHETFICGCGSTYTYNHRARHFKTKKHLKFLQTAVSEQE